MFDRFGPWSSAFGDDPSPHLSTFWKRRLTMLAQARAARPMLTRRDWLKLGVAGAAACALPTLLPASADGPDTAKATDPGKIYLYAHLDSGDAGDSIRGVFAVDPGNGSWIKVSDFAGSIRISRDGRTVAMSRSGWTGHDFREIDNVGLWTQDAEGKEQARKIADFGGVVSWSPDSKQLIVAKELSKPREDTQRHETWRLNADGSGATRMPIPEADEVDDWSLDGRWLVTVSDRHPPHGRGYQLYLMRPDGTNERRLTEGGGLNVYPRFSPDSQRIAYLHQERGKNSVCVVNIDGSGRRPLLEEENHTTPHHFCWSPDGKSLACSTEDRSRDEQGKGRLSDKVDSIARIVIIDADGKDRRPLNLSRARWIGAPDWR